jgi:hypothetical protein
MATIESSALQLAAAKDFMECLQDPGRYTNWPNFVDDGRRGQELYGFSYKNLSERTQGIIFFHEDAKNGTIAIPVGVPPGLHSRILAEGGQVHRYIYESAKARYPTLNLDTGWSLNIWQLCVNARNLRYAANVTQATGKNARHSREVVAAQHLSQLLPGVVICLKIGPAHIIAAGEVSPVCR